MWWKYFCKCQNEVVPKYYPDNGCHCWRVDGVSPGEIAEFSVEKIKAIELGKETLTDQQKRAGYFLCHNKLCNAYFPNAKNCECYQKIKNEFLKDRPYIGSIRALLDKLEGGCIK